MSFLIIAVCALAGVAGLASAETFALARTVDIFEAHLQEAPCGNKRCGAGELIGFGRFKTWETVRFVGAPPAAGCAAVVGTRTLTLVRKPKSTLVLAISGVICGSRGWGTFKVSSGRGVFLRATGSGVILESAPGAFIC